MPPDPATLKPDPRSPLQLSLAILDHEFSPEGGDFKRVSFREMLEYNADDHGHPAARLLWPLKHLADGQPLSPFDRIDLSHGLEVIAAYKADSTDARDRYAMHSNPDLLPRNEAMREARQVHLRFGRPDTDAQRESADDMETSAVELGNLKAIRALLSHPRPPPPGQREADRARPHRRPRLTRIPSYPIGRHCYNAATSWRLTTVMALTVEPFFVSCSHFRTLLAC